jgi:hypothetical protein
MVVDLKYTRVVMFEGRNGYFKCSGMHTLMLPPEEGNSKKDLLIYPITSKGVTGRGCIQIPEEDIPELIKVLQSFINVKE